MHKDRKYNIHFSTDSEDRVYSGEVGIDIAWKDGTNQRPDPHRLQVAISVVVDNFVHNLPKLILDEYCKRKK